MGNQISHVPRIVHIGQPDKENFPDNRVISSKYTIWNFLPKNFYEQFRRFANMCFVGATVLSVFTKGPVSPVIYALPICTMMAVSAMKQGYEDYCRHRADHKVNQTPVNVLRSSCPQEIPCKNVRVGDIVLVSGDEDIPCDLILLGSNQTDGNCFLTTANLDGETNLKVRQCPIGLNLTAHDLANISGTIECEEPTPNLYTFSGVIKISEKKRMDDYCGHQVNAAFERSSESIPALNGLQKSVLENYNEEYIYSTALTSEHILLRGCRLKNTSYIYGCAVYTGKETKLSLNSRLSKNKFSTVEKAINWFLGFFFLMLVLEALSSTFVEMYCAVNAPYLGENEEINPVATFFDYIILYYYIIPISMYVTIELQRLIGTVFFEWDLLMYCKGKRALCNTSDLNEDLGQVEYVFTDKTGTLTENEMEFQRCSVGGRMYYECSGQICLLPESGCSQSASALPSEQWPKELWDFLFAMSICHTAYCNPDTKHSSLPLYQASSPDEKALIEAAARCGVVYVGNEHGYINIMVNGKVQSFRKVEVLEFSSERKRMSIIVVDENNIAWLFCKGAESSIIPLLHEDSSSETAMYHLQDFSTRGLRTLVLARRQLSPEDLILGRSRLANARCSGNEMDPDRRQAFMDEIYSSLETNLELLGVSAVEDRLQDLVPETLTSLQSAGIKLWVLTGDKLETAKSIAYSCGHFKPGTELLVLAGHHNLESCLQQLQVMRLRVREEKSCGFLMDGFSFFLIHSSTEGEQMLLEVAMGCTAAVCCRLSPKQKAQLVKMVKHSPSHPTTLAIGDGANDVSMIQEAHVGIGIMGKEGQQAVRCSDFAFAEFQCLRRALLVHGHWYYLRAATLVQYFFYKNIVFITPQVYFAFGVSPAALYASLFLLLYNTLFTFMPILIFSLMEQDYKSHVLMNYPELYKLNRRNKLMTWYNFLLWILFGVWHSLVIYFVPYCTLLNENMILNRNIDLTTFGTTVLHNAVLVVNFKLLLHSRNWTSVFVMSIVISVLGFIAFSFVYSNFFRAIQIVELDFVVMVDVYRRLYWSPWFWLVSVLSICLSLLPDVAIYVIRNVPDASKRLKPKFLTVHKSFDLQESNGCTNQT